MFSVGTVGNEGAATVVRVAGELDIATAPELRTCLLTNGGTDIILDLSDLTFMDSSGLSVLIVAHRRAGELSHSLVLRSPTAIVARVIQISGADEMLTIET